MLEQGCLAELFPSSSVGPRGSAHVSAAWGLCESPLGKSFHSLSTRQGCYGIQ